MSNCISNLLLNKIFEHLQERESSNQQGRMSRGRYFIAVSVAEIGILAFTATAIGEAVLSAFLTLATLPLCLITNKPYNFFASLLTNSLWTVVKGLASSVMNIFFLSRSMRPAREESNMPQPEQSELVDQGANFITNEVLADVAPEIVSLVRDMDPEMYMFILTKAVSIYTIGNKRNDPLPQFFRLETRNKISQLRQELPEATSADLVEVIKDLEKQEIGPERETDKDLFGRLREIAYGEFRGLFISQCLQKAGQQIPGVEAEDFYANAI